MRIALAASEVIGFAKTGGLADVCGALPVALEKLGHEVAVFMPMYETVRRAGNYEPTGISYPVPIGPYQVWVTLYKSILPHSSVPVYFIANHENFERDNPSYGRGIYQFQGSDGNKKDYPDNSSRFLLLTRAVLESFPQMGFWPDVFHTNDWQTGLGPVLLRELYDRHPNLNWARQYQKIRTLFTIHNIAYQGNFWKHDLNATHLGWNLFNYRQLEFHDMLSYLKAGIVFADRVNTVSPTYAMEIQTPYYGYGMQSILTAHADKLSGIVNGIDYHIWDPSNDKFLSGHYDAENILPGKAECKRSIQVELGLQVDDQAPLVGMVARLVSQKGLDLVLDAMWGMMDLGIQFIVLGEGDQRYHQALSYLRERYPNRVALQFGFDESLAHRIEAGVDMFLMPSLYEPSGLNQLYSMRYGSLPIVRATGGLADTVTDTTDQSLANGTATGFSFPAYNWQSLLDTTRRAVCLYHDRRDLWQQVQRNAMREDWSWNRSAKSYASLYESMMD
jgi:starch synthase